MRCFTRKHNRSAFTLAETLCAVALLATLIGGIYEVSTRSLRAALSSREGFLASSVLNERLGALRRTPWDVMTQSESYEDDSWVDEDGVPQTFTGLFSLASKSGESLPGLVEVLTISEYPSPPGNPPSIQVIRTASGVTTTGTSIDLSDVAHVRADLKVSWEQGLGKRTRSQEASAIFSKGGS
jgi:type II secretory pathway pseudopilin PulG